MRLTDLSRRGSADMTRLAALPLITVLFFGRGPSAIARFVVAVIIDTINRHAFRHTHHVGNKILDPVPTLANDYSSAPIIFIGRMFWVVAAMNHANPAFIHFGARQVVRNFLPVKGARMLFCQLGVQASARFCAATFKSADIYGFLIAAIAKAVPSSAAAAMVRRAADNDKPPKPLSDAINELWHDLQDKGRHTDTQDFGIGVGSLLATTGAALWASSNQKEPTK